jgi:predicted nuclease of predicted toxin-antitoxin system
MKLLADENLHTGIIQGLRNANFEVIFVPEVNLAGRKDREILEFAEKNDLLVISGDKDFGGLIEFLEACGRYRISVFNYPDEEIGEEIKKDFETAKRVSSV